MLWCVRLLNGETLLSTVSRLSAGARGAAAGHQAEHHTIGEETGPAEHAAHTDSTERLEQVVDKFDIHNSSVRNSSVCHSAALQAGSFLSVALMDQGSADNDSPLCTKRHVSGTNST